MLRTLGSVDGLACKHAAASPLVGGSSAPVCSPDGMVCAVDAVQYQAPPPGSYPPPPGGYPPPPQGYPPPQGWKQ